MELWKLIRKFQKENGRMPFGSELDKLKILAKKLENAQDKIASLDTNRGRKVRKKYRRSRV